MNLSRACSMTGLKTPQLKCTHPQVRPYLFLMADTASGRSVRFDQYDVSYHIIYVDDLLTIRPGYQHRCTRNVPGMGGGRCFAKASRQCPRAGLR